MSPDRMKPLSAARLLQIRQEVRQETEDELERALLCNARVLAESCYLGEEAAFDDAEAVLNALSCREMEELLRRLTSGQQTKEPSAENPKFDPERFHALRRDDT